MICPWCRVDKKIKQLSDEVSKMSLQIDALKNQVTNLVADVKAEGDAVKAAALAIKGLTDQQAVLTQQLQDAIAANDPAEIQAAADAIRTQNEAIIAQTADLAAAIPASV
jgi:outer membrane murein-binding lipoprotein Lpp